MIKFVLILVAAITVSSTSLVITLGAIAKNKSPELALSLTPTNGFAAETLAAQRTKILIARNQGKFPRRLNQSSSILARKAFESEPIAPDAIAIIALTHAGKDRRDLMQKAFELSRRQQLVTGWMITDSGLRNDLPAVLQLYDTILRTSSSSADVIIPAMANALENDSSIKPFAKVLSDNPPWAGRLWIELVANPKTIENAASLRKLLNGAKGKDQTYQDAALINTLAYNRKFKKAEQLYAMLTGSSRNHDLIRNGRFDNDSIYPPIDWQLFSTGEYGASIDQGKLTLSAIRNAGGLFARQLVKIPAELLTLKVAFTDTLPAENRLYLELSCAEEIQNKPLAIRIPLSGKSITRGINNSGTTCGYYWLDITGKSADNGDGFDVSINSIMLDRQADLRIGSAPSEIPRNRSGG